MGLDASAIEIPQPAHICPFKDKWYGLNSDVALEQEDRWLQCRIYPLSVWCREITPPISALVALSGRRFRGPCPPTLAQPKVMSIA